MLLLRDVFTILLELIFTIFLWGVVVFGVVLPSLPVWLPLMCLRKMEKWIYETCYHMERMDSDAVFWMLDTPKNKSIINGLMMVHEHFELKRFQQFIQNKMIETKNDRGDAKYPNATKFVKEGMFNYYWCMDQAFDISKHVYAWSTNIYTSTEEMIEAMNGISIRPFTRENKSSPWEFILLYFLENGVEKTCIFIRCHHSLADGVSFVNFIVNKLSDEISLQIQPRKVPNAFQIMMKTKGIFYMPLTLLKITLLDTPTHHLHCSNVSGEKDLMWSRPISLRLIKAIKHKLQVTINDVLAGCLAASIHQYFKDHDKRVPNHIMTSFPFNTRYSLKEAETFSNKFAVVFLPLPTKSSNALENVMEINKRMNLSKYSADHHGMRYGAQIMNTMLPLSLNKIIFASLSSFSSMVLSNVPGPQLPIKLDGAMVEMMCFWPPQKENIGLAASMLSYNDEIRIAFSCDTALKTKPHELLNTLPDLFKSLAETIGVNDLHCSE